MSVMTMTRPAPRRPIATARDGLTRRQREILIEVASRGRSNKEIAAELGISARTVGNHLTDLYRRARLGAGGRRSRVALVRWAWNQPGWREVDAAARAEGRTT